MSEVRHPSVERSMDENPFYAPNERVSAESWNYVEPMPYQQHPPVLTPGGGMVSDARDFAPTQPLNHATSAPMFHDPNTYQRLLGATNNPFQSPHDDEAIDVISPLDPPLAKKLDRIRSLPLVHYPSWSEVSDFDFTGGVAEAKNERRSHDGWHPWRERKDGRYELA